MIEIEKQVVYSFNGQSFGTPEEAMAAAEIQTLETALSTIPEFASADKNALHSFAIGLQANKVLIGPLLRVPIKRPRLTTEQKAARKAEMEKANAGNKPPEKANKQSRKQNAAS